MKQPDLLYLLRERNIRALIFDLDGVVTRTARVHARAWKKMFDAYLMQRGRQDGKTYEPLRIETDYPQYIDGIPRYDGVRNFLRSRGIELPEGTAEDEPGTETIAGLGKLKNQYFRQELEQGGVDVYTDTIAFIQQQRQQGLHTAIISASKNCRYVLQAAGLEQLFETRIDGEVAAARNLPGKPAPDVFLEAARELGVPPAACAVFEDARAGVKAGRAGGFALVVGINRVGAEEEKALLHNGADIVISTFEPEHKPMNKTTDRQVQQHPVTELPHALHNPELKKQLREKTPAIFLDYDGCLTPIVKNPEDALLSEEMRQVLRGLAEKHFVAIVSGRDRADVEQKVQLENLYYAGSHGFDISGPHNLKTEPGGAKVAIPALDKAQETLGRKLKDVPGVLVERKRYAIAVHYRNVPPEQEDYVKQTVHDVLRQHEELKPGPGKKVIELKPRLDWHKGRAVEWLLQEMNLNKPSVLPIYIGDDLTDEDAFATLQHYGIGIMVGSHGEETAARYALHNVPEVSRFLSEIT